jgi:hypothetical protein
VAAPTTNTAAHQSVFTGEISPKKARFKKEKFLKEKKKRI